MKILLDNCVDRRLARFLSNHDVIHTSRVGLSAVYKDVRLKSVFPGVHFSTLPREKGSPQAQA